MAIIYIAAPTDFTLLVTAGIRFVMKLGIDIGSVTAKVAVLDEADSIIESRYIRTRGQPIETVLAILEDLLVKYPPGNITVTAATGTGGQLLDNLLGLR